MLLSLPPTTAPIPEGELQVIRYGKVSIPVSFLLPVPGIAFTPTVDPRAVAGNGPWLSSLYSLG